MSPSKPISKKNKRATIYDLARLAKVSPGTVSRVLNNRDKVKADTRERVLRCARELNLKPQASVRAKQYAILSEPTFSDRIRGYAATLTAHLAFAFSRRNSSVVLPTDPLKQLPGSFLDGVVAVTYEQRLLSLLEKLESRMPVVYMDRFDHPTGHCAVCSDHYNAGYLAAQHFLARGKHKLAFLGGDVAPFRERLRGYRKAMEEAGVVPDERLLLLFEPALTYHSYHSIIARIVRAGADCIFVPGSSFEAIECLHVLNYVMGVKVPQQISLIGGENEGISALQYPPLTTIKEPLKEMAEQAAQMIERLTAGDRLANKRIILPVRLIERDSVS